MRWEDLFADLEGQWDALAEAGRQAEIAERTRAEFARVGLAERLRGSEGRQVRLVARGHALSGELSRVGADFVLVTVARGECVLPLRALDTVVGLGPESVPAEVAGPVRARLGLGSVLRRIAADRSAVTVVAGPAGPGGPAVPALSGRVQRVGADFFELTGCGRPDAQAHPAAGGRVTLVPFAALVLVRRDTPA